MNPKQTINVLMNNTLFIFRFVYHEMVSVKVDSEVDFPLEGLCLPRHISGPVTCDLTYDLNSIVCHFGGRFKLYWFII